MKRPSRPPQKAVAPPSFVGVVPGAPGPAGPDVEKVRARLEQLATPKARERGMDRSGGVNPINKPRAEKRRTEDFGPCSRAARRGACSVPGCKSPPPQEPGHVRSRGAGGHDWKNVIGLCSKHHREQHDSGVATFAARYRISLDDLACQVAEVVEGHACADFWEQTRRRGQRCAICLKPKETS